jgi:hypothetical protein
MGGGDIEFNPAGVAANTTESLLKKGFLGASAARR